MVGTIIEGFASGYFGRDSYGDRRVEATGVDWVVARDLESGHPMFAEGELIHVDLAKHVKSTQTTEDQ